MISFSQDSPGFLPPSLALIPEYIEKLLGEKISCPEIISYMKLSFYG